MAEPIRCSKDDKFRTGACQCEECALERLEKQQEAELTGIIITDAHMIPEEITTRSGFTFGCPQCKSPASIMAPTNHCRKCGIKVTIQSDKLTAFVKQHMS